MIIDELSSAIGTNIFDDIPAESSKEIFSELISSGNARIERIVSFGQSSDPGFWYDQDENEFVILISGSATLEFKVEELEVETVLLKPGDYLNIPAHKRHRIAATDANDKTIWLVVFY